MWSHRDHREHDQTPDPPSLHVVDAQLTDRSEASAARLTRRMVSWADTLFS